MDVFAHNSQPLIPQELVFAILATTLLPLLLLQFLAPLVLIFKLLMLQERLASVLQEPLLRLVTVLVLCKDILNNLLQIAHY